MKLAALPALLLLTSCATANVGPTADSSVFLDGSGGSSGDTTGASSDGADLLDEVDKRVIDEVAAVCTGLANTAMWQGLTLCSRPLLLVRRSVKGTPTAALLWLPPGRSSPVGLPTDRPNVRRVDEAKGVLSALQSHRVDAPLGADTVLAVAYDGAMPEPAWAWTGALGAAAMERLQLVDDSWAPVEGCGRAAYPRVQSLIAHTLLESVLLAEAATASDAELPSLARDLHAIRAHRRGLHAMVARIDNDAENVHGPGSWARSRLPVLAGMRSSSAARSELATAILSVTEVALNELDDALLWKRPLHTGPIWLEVASRLGWPLAQVYKAGGAAADAATTELGPPDASRLPALRSRHDWAAMLATAQALMQR